MEECLNTTRSPRSKQPWRSTLFVFIACLCVNSGNAPSQASTAAPATGNFSVQVPIPPPVQGGMPRGVLPPTIGAPNAGSPPSAGNPSNSPVAPAGGGTSPRATDQPYAAGGQGSAYQSNYNTGGANDSQPSQPVKSEIVTFDEKHQDRPVLVVKTSEGEFKIRMAADINRDTVQHFMGLAQGTKEFIDIRTGKKVRRPFYSGLNCHRVLKGVLIQCGCPFGNGRGNPGVLMKDERNSGIRFDKPGVVAMSLQIRTKANGFEDAPDTAGSQFFISLAKLPEFEGKYAIIGEITSGMETIRKIASTPTGPTDRPIKRVVIFSIDPDIATTTETAPAVPAAPMNNLAPSGPGNDPFALPPDEN
jgi:peptidyl-prolyl cis-trans isomerase A (cyclophilin A)